MSSNKPQPSEINRLKNLAGDPEAQAVYAAGLLEPGASRSILQAALAVLAQTPLPEARPAILAVYEHMAANGPKRDPGGYMRKAALDALRPVATFADAELLLQAVTTYEFLPPDFREEASLVRGSALVALNEADDQLAAYYATRLLVDEHTEEMSGEPAVTAARLLAGQDQLLPLYQAVMLPRGTASAEVRSECLRNLTAIPVTLVPGIVDTYRESTNPTILLGLFDLLIQHREGAQELPFLEETLARLKDPDLYRYLLIALLSARKKPLDDLVIRGASFETDRSKVAVLLEVLNLFDLGASGAELNERLRRRAPQQRRG